MKDFTTQQLKAMLGVKSPTNFKPSSIMDFSKAGLDATLSSKSGSYFTDSLGSKAGAPSYQSYNYYGYGTTYSAKVPDSYDVRDKYPNC